MTSKINLKQKSILFIIEENVFKGEACFDNSNDVFLISQALFLGFRVYLTTPQAMLKQALGKELKEFENFTVLQLSSQFDRQKIIQQIQTSFYYQVLNCLVAMPPKPDSSNDTQSKVLLFGAKTSQINLLQLPIFNRAEPISLSNQFYDLLIALKGKQAKILPDPQLNKILGDKLAIYAIHNNQKIANINLLEGVNLKGGNNKISFKTKFIAVGDDNFSSKKAEQFYQLLIADNFVQAKLDFALEYKSFTKAAKEYLKFHQQLKNDSIIKPANYFSGVGLVVQKQPLSLNWAMKNIALCCSAVLEDFQLYNKTGANLPVNQIIVQERATKANLGDLRIMFSGNHFQGVFVRVNRNFSQSQANNLHFGGHIENLFKKYSPNKDGVKQMILDIKNSQAGNVEEEIRKAKALNGLLKTINFLQQIKIFEQYPIIGIDALLTENKKGDYCYKVNEINLTSPLGHNFLAILEMAVWFNDLAVEILQQHNFPINLAKHQILSDYFNNQDVAKAVEAREILIGDINLQNLIKLKTSQIFTDNFASQTLEYF